MTLKADHTKELNYELKATKAELTGDPARKSDAWSMVPELKYTFTDNITGTARYTGSIKSDKVTTVKSNLIEAIVEIRF